MRSAIVAVLGSISVATSTQAFISPRKQKSEMNLRASLSDQLSSLSYDKAIIGRFSAAAEKSLSATSASSVESLPTAAVNGLPSLSLPDISLPTLFDALSNPVSTASTIIESTQSTVQLYELLADDKLTALLGDTWTTTKEQLGPAFLILPNLPPSVTLLIASYLTYSVVITVLSFGQEPPPSSPYPNNKYDPISARRYFDGKLGLVLQRAFVVTLLSTTFLLGVALDFVRGKLESNADQRAKELSVLLTKLGPSFIKIGQSLSIRTDLLSPAYVRGLKSLQDQVPPFSNSEARKIIENELGGSIDDVFVSFPQETIAAASLGQVYKATIRTKTEKAEEIDVAVKVQRPEIMSQIALDMHLIREVAPIIRRTFNLNTDFVGVVDTWARGFVDELDYIEEAINAKAFMEGIQQTPLSGVVFSPPVLDELTTRKVLTTEWVVGERLDKSGKDDVSILCSIAMNSYLTMMLETGLLHCDPHPGNLLRTSDGQLCILDWGMVTRLDPDLQLTLIEHMAHLTSADYEEIPKDLLQLGFIPEDKAGLIRDSGIVETLAEIYGAWTAGGGAAAVNVNKVIADLQDLTAEKGNVFQIPPYFAYIAKSFSVLEGIGLSNDSKYSIINECLPYVSKRLLTDKSERTGGALSTFIFGPAKSDNDRIIDYDRVEQLVSGFGSYTSSASGELLGKDSTRAEAIENLATQVLDLLATEEDTPLQKIFVEQIAKIITASSRTAWSQLRESSGVLPSGRSLLGFLVDPLGVFRTSPVVRANDLDERTVETTRNLIQLLTTAGGPSVDVSSLSNAEVVEITSIIVSKLWESRTGVVSTTNRLATELLKLTADRLEKGEREIRVLSTNEPETVGKITESSTNQSSSERLANARQILATVE